MRGIKKVAMTLSVFVLATGWVMAAEYQETFDQTYSLAPGGKVSLENVNGDVSVEVWESSEVRVYAVRSASSPELLEGLKVKVDANSNEVHIDTRYPSNKNKKVNSSERQFMRVEYTLTVPRTATLDEIDLVNGNLSVVGVEGGVDAETVNGNIVVRDCAGGADLATVNGAIEAYFGRLDAGEDLDLESVNGTLDLYLGSAAGADLRAETVNGELSNDFGIDVHKGKYVGADFRGSVGGGGAQVSMETVNGAIRVHSW